MQHFGYLKQLYNYVELYNDLPSKSYIASFNELHSRLYKILVCIFYAMVGTRRAKLSNEASGWWTSMDCVLW